ncbi:hypothetical protein F4808DRAFT_101144 [Astrocystis sublimbata]|nr:hypothetical protein F4808DRAFT_101144 [Astrocystis sublimbata]
MRAPIAETADSAEAGAGRETRETGETGPLSFNHDTHAWISRLHEAWSDNPSAAESALAVIRDGLLNQRERTDLHIFTLASVAQVACPALACVGNGRQHRWDELFRLAGLTKPTGVAAITTSSRKRKRAYNETNRLRNLSLVAALWSPAVVFHYGWNTASQVQLNLLRACASSYPRFALDFLPRLNCVLLQRHCQAITHGRAKTLIEAPLQPHRDLDLRSLALACPDVDVENHWTTNQDGTVTVGDPGSLLRDLRPNHFRIYLLRKDRFGLLAARGDEHTPSSPPDSGSSLNHRFGHLPIEPRSLTEPQSLVHNNNNNNDAGEMSNWLSPHLPLGDTNLQSLLPSSLSHSALPSARDFDTTLASAAGQLGTNSCLSLDAECDDEHFHDCLSLPPSASLESDLERPGTLTPDARDNSDVATTITSHSPASSHLDDDSNCSTLRTPDLTVGSVLSSSPSESNQSDQSESLTIEESIHRRYISTISLYNSMIELQAMEANIGDWRKVSRAEWLHHTTRWASVYTPPGSGLLRGRAPSCELADVLYTTSDTMLKAWQSGEVLRKPIVIKETFTDSGMHSAHRILSLLQHAPSDAILGASSMDDETFEPDSITHILDDHRFERRDVNGVVLRLRNNITRSHRPVFTMLPRFRLLNGLLESCGKCDEPAAMTDFTDFSHLMLRGAFSGACLSVAGGLWLRNLDGVIFITMIREEDMAQDWEAFGLMGPGWIPNRKQRFFLLERDDVLVIPPGLRMVYAIHSPTDGTLEGGSFWDSYSIPDTVQSLRWIYEHRLAREHLLVNYVPRLIAELEALIKRHDNCSVSMDSQLVKETFRRG